jgi:FkbM family methyltransferase
MIKQLKNLVFKFRHGFRGAPIALGGEVFRVDESLRRWDASGEAWVFQKMAEILKPGDGFLDIGANFGFHTLIASNKIGVKGQILAVEPIPKNLRILRKNIQLNGIARNTRIEEAAVSDSSAPFVAMAATGSGPDVTAAIHLKPTKDALEVPNRALDSFSWSREFTPKLVKIDIEGAELSALKSGVEFLKRVHPILLIEVHANLLPGFGASAEDMNDFLSRLGYKLLAKEDVDGSQDGCWHGVYSV